MAILAKTQQPNDRVLIVNASSPFASNYEATTTLQKPTVVRSSMFSSPVSYREGDNGNPILEGLRIFKHGTFRDSLGIEKTWEALHLDEMAMYYHHLKDSGVFSDVPLRTDHSASVKDVGGYLIDLYRDKQDDLYLATDVEITEPDVFDKWKRKTYRNVSLEVGMYETNDGATYWPVVMGVAFVDIPAVEGLHSHGSKPSFFFSQSRDYNKETETMELQAFLAACRYAQWVIDAEYAQKVQDWENASNYAAALEAHAQQALQLGIGGGNSSHQNPGGGGNGVQFRVGGQVISDVGEVQRQIDSLEGFQSETVKLNRTNFVENLISNNKILASQKDDYMALVEGMTPEQFVLFQKANAGAANANILNLHGNPGAGGSPDAQGPTDIETQELIVKRLRDSGMSNEQVEKTGAYKKLQSLKTPANG